MDTDIKNTEEEVSTVWAEDNLPTGEGDGNRSENNSEDQTTPESKPGFYVELDLLKSIITGKHKWSSYLNNENFVDVKQALKIVYGYHPKNNGKDTGLPKATLGDIERMREDLMHLSALNCYLAAQAAMYETNADNIEQERKLSRSVNWTVLRKKIRGGQISEKLTQDDIKNEAEAGTVDLYRLEYELRTLGRMYNWVRAAVRTFTEHLAVLIQSSMREERGDANLR